MAESTKVALFSRLIDSPVLLVFLGASFLILGLAGGVTYNNWLPISNLGARFSSGLIGCAILVWGIYLSWRTQGVIPDAKRFGIKIDHPQQGDRVDIVDVRGSMEKPLPKDYTLRIFRIYPKSNYYVPVSEGRMTNGGAWEALGCNIGGNTGDERFIGAYMVGPGGAAFLNYYAKAAKEHRMLMIQLRDATGKEGKYLPLIEERTPDMIECARVKVWRK